MIFHGDVFEYLMALVRMQQALNRMALYLAAKDLEYTAITNNLTNAASETAEVEGTKPR